MSGPYLTEDDYLENFRLDAFIKDSKVVERRVYSDRRKGFRKVVETKEWTRKEEIGRGGFGVVHLEQDELGKTRAVKEVPRMIGRQANINPMRELIAMATLSKNEANFVKLEGWFQSDAHLYIVMEYFELGDLHHCLNQPVPEKEAQDIVLQLSEALHFMHEKNFTHRDLKPANVFVVARSPNWWVKLADLGISKRVRGGDSTALYTSFDGDFMAPEVLGFSMDSEMDHYTSAVDMWALGVVAFWLMTLQVPVPRRNYFAFCNGKYNLTFDNLTEAGVSKPGVHFVERLVKSDPNERMSSAEVVEHDWLITVEQSTGSEPSFGDTFHVSTEPQAETDAVKLENKIKNQNTLVRKGLVKEVTSVNAITGRRISPDRSKQTSINITVPRVEQMRKIPPPIPTRIGNQATPSDIEQMQINPEPVVSKSSEEQQSAGVDSSDTRHATPVARKPVPVETTKFKSTVPEETSVKSTSLTVSSSDVRTHSRESRTDRWLYGESSNDGTDDLTMPQAGARTSTKPSDSLPVLYSEINGSDDNDNPQQFIMDWDARFKQQRKPPSKVQDDVVTLRPELALGDKNTGSSDSRPIQLQQSAVNSSLPAKHDSSDMAMPDYSRLWSLVRADRPVLTPTSKREERQRTVSLQSGKSQETQRKSSGKQAAVARHVSDSLNQVERDAASHYLLEEEDRKLFTKPPIIVNTPTLTPSPKKSSSLFRGWLRGKSDTQSSSQQSPQSSLATQLTEANLGMYNAKVGPHPWYTRNPDTEAMFQGHKPRDESSDD